MVEAKSIVVTGRVQGVGFRYFTKILVDRLGVTGVVWNASDGSVRIEAQGDEMAMKDFVNGVSVSLHRMVGLIRSHLRRLLYRQNDEFLRRFSDVYQSMFLN